MTRSAARRALGAGVAVMAAAACFAAVPAALAGQPLSYEVVAPDSLASAMMLGLINQDSVLILDKTEGNPTKLPNGKTVWGSIMNLTDNSVRPVDVNTNTFCASGATLPNGTWVVVGGNQAITTGGVAATANNNAYGDLDGRLAIRLMNIDNVPDSGLNWLDNGGLQMASPRWYPGIEVLATGEVVIIGGSTSGGYINRNTPNVDPAFETSTVNGGSITNLYAGGANPTYEYYPPRANVTGAGTYKGMQISNFMNYTSGLNMYPHTYLLPSGRIFMNANYSNVIWDHNQNIEMALPDTPGRVIRVYPASGAAAMMPLTKANNYTPSILFCGGTVLDDDMWGNYSLPGTNMLNVQASTDCSYITPENADGSINSQGWVQDDPMPEGRTMGQFIHLPTGQMLIVNGANKGTAGYGNAPWNSIPYQGATLYTEGFSADPVYTPVLYDPEKPAGQRFTSSGFGASNIARLYHSSAILLPDGSVLIGGSNPHVDFNQSMPIGTTPQGYNTTYELEKWYPDYYFKTRPQPQGMPTVIPFGGSPFNVTMDAGYMGKSANALAAATKFMVIRPGFSTHAMNMGQRSMQLDNTYVVNSDGSVTYTVNPMPTNPNLFVAGPALLFCTINGVPSMGQFVSVGANMDAVNVPWTPQLGAPLQTLYTPVNNSAYNAALPGSGMSLSTGAIIGIAVGGAAVLLAIGLIAFCCIRRRRGRGAPLKSTKGAYSYANNPALGTGAAGGPPSWDGTSEYKAPVQQQQYGQQNLAPHSQQQAFGQAPHPSQGTFASSYAMGDVSQAGESREALGAYFDRQNGAASPYSQRTPLATPHPQSPGLVPSAHSHGSYQQGWAEHQAAGDAGEYYQNGGAGAAMASHPSQQASNDASRYYDYPSAGSQQQQYYQQQQQHQQHYAQ